MKLKLLIVYVFASMAVSCQFTETMILNEDGSGSMAVEVNLSEMMAFGGISGADSTVTKIDTIIHMKRFLEEKKDSIATLSEAQQQELKRLEAFKIHMKVDSEAAEMVYDISTNFNVVSDANDILSGLGPLGNMLPDPDANTKIERKDDSPDFIGTAFSYKNGRFKRDAYIKDKKVHQQQMDSMKQAEAFLSGANYTLKYTFPREIKKVSNEAATFSEDKKTVILQKPFLEYLKNPDILDLEVELEDN